MLVTRSARLLAIDGGYIHVSHAPVMVVHLADCFVQIMPQANKAKNVFESGKTASYDIKSIVACQQSSKNSATFKLVVHRGDTERNKRYEFEAESPKLAGEWFAVVGRAPSPNMFVLQPKLCRLYAA